MLVGLSIRLTDEPNVDDLRDVVKWLKNSAVRRYGTGVMHQQWQPYDGRLWQKGFHDHIVRNENELEIIRKYIDTNVQSWEKDTFYDGFMDW
jgi:REP element-mobilizing transposase RayT